MKFYSKLFASVYDKALSVPEKKILSEKRKKLIAPLHGNILEVGCGTGVNFPYYNEDACVIACEPSEEMLKYAQKKIKEGSIRATIELIGEGLYSQALSDRIKPSSLDAVVCTLVLCTIPDPGKAFPLFYQWLRPGGRLILLEHIQSKNKTGKIIQNLVTPAWKHIAEGCHLNRSTDDMAKKAGFSIVKENYFRYIAPFYEAELMKPA
jgi:ubiquinone/menaquinone biosynthesis C-methylase UbiE